VTKELSALHAERGELVDRLLATEEQLAALEQSFADETRSGGSAVSDWHGYLSPGHSAIAARSSGSTSSDRHGSTTQQQQQQQHMLFSWSSAGRPTRSGRYPPP